MSVTATAIQLNVGVYTQINQVNQAFQQLTDSSSRAATEQRNFDSAAQNSQSSTDVLAQKVKNLAGAFKPLEAVKKLVELSDQTAQVDARLNLLFDGSSVEQLNQEIMDSANRARTSYMDTADAVLNLATHAKGAFSSDQEMISFTEVFQKTLAVSGASQSEIQAASEQMAQALGDGTLQGEELNAIFPTAPNGIQLMADYMGRPVSEIQKMAEQGKITSDIVKNSFLSATDSVNEQFGNMPMTWSQVGTLAMNGLIDAARPLLTLVSNIAQHWGTLEPILVAVAAALGAVAIAQGIMTVATWISTGAAKAFAMALLTNPLTYIALAIGLIVYVIYQWVQSVGGIKIAWLICMNVLLTAWDLVKIGLVTGIFWVMNKFSMFSLNMKTITTNIANFIGDMKVNALILLENMINGSIDMINTLISKLNGIPGVEIELLEQVSFGAAAQAENEAEKQKRNSELAAYGKKVSADIAGRGTTLEQMKADAAKDKAKRQAEIDKLQMENQSGNSAAEGAAGSNANVPDKDKYARKTAENTYKTAQAAEGMNEALDITSENIRYIRDFSTQRAINRHTSTQIKVEMTNHNSIRGDQDIDGIVNKLGRKLQENLGSSAEGVH